MAYPKRLAEANHTNKEKAIESHAGFIRFVASEVNKRGMQAVLSQAKGDELYWLKKAYDRLLNFAEAIQIKQTEDPSPANSQPIVVVIEKTEANENQLQAPRFAVPNIQ